MAYHDRHSSTIDRRRHFPLDAPDVFGLLRQSSILGVRAGRPSTMKHTRTAEHRRQIRVHDEPRRRRARARRVHGEIHASRQDVGQKEDE